MFDPNLEPWHNGFVIQWLFNVFSPHSTQYTFFGFFIIHYMFLWRSYNFIPVFSDFLTVKGPTSLFHPTEFWFIICNIISLLCLLCQILHHIGYNPNYNIMRHFKFNFNFIKSSLRKKNFSRIFLSKFWINLMVYGASNKVLNLNNFMFEYILISFGFLMNT